MKNAAWLVLLFAALCAGQTFPSPGPNSPYPNGGSVVTIPSASPAGNSYIYVSVGAAPALTSVTSGASIVYTVDGSTPTVSSGCTVTHGTLLSNGGSLSTFYVTTTVKALGCKAGMTPSSVASLAYTLSSLVGGWPMENGSGTTSTDPYTGNNLTITPGGGSWGTLAGVSGGVYNFDGTATLMTAANHTNLDFNYNQDFSGWCAVDFTSTGSYETLISTLVAGSSYQGWEFSLAYFTGNYFTAFFLVNAYPSNALQVDSIPSISAGALHDVGFSYNGSVSHTHTGVKLYIDGANVSGTAVSDTLTTTTTNSQVPVIGARPNSTDFLKGDLGPCYTGNRVWTGAEFSALHSNFYNVPN